MRNLSRRRSILEQRNERLARRARLQRMNESYLYSKDPAIERIIEVLEDNNVFNDLVGYYEFEPTPFLNPKWIKELIENIEEGYEMSLEQYKKDNF